MGGGEQSKAGYFWGSLVTFCGQGEIYSLFLSVTQLSICALFLVLKNQK